MYPIFLDRGVKLVKFFNRCRVLNGVLTLLCIIAGLLLAFLLFDYIRYDTFELISAKELVHLIFTILLFFIFLLSTITLKCIIKDAQEDLEAVAKYAKSHDSTTY